MQGRVSELYFLTNPHRRRLRVRWYRTQKNDRNDYLRGVISGLLEGAVWNE